MTSRTHAAPRVAVHAAERFSLTSTQAPSLPRRDPRPRPSTLDLDLPPRRERQVTPYLDLPPRRERFPTRYLDLPTKRGRFAWS